jgi:hypothetical protein
LQKILIDENLSPSLAADAQQKGFLCSHVNHLGKTGTKDWNSSASSSKATGHLLPTTAPTFAGLRMNQALLANTRTCAFTRDWSASTLHLA